jgi:hypothetical protein
VAVIAKIDTKEDTNSTLRLKRFISGYFIGKYYQSKPFKA